MNTFNWIRHPWWTSCAGKKAYASLDACNSAGRSSMFNSGFQRQLYMYECQYCNKWHLTSQETEHRVF